MLFHLFFHHNRAFSRQCICGSQNPRFWGAVLYSGCLQEEEDGSQIFSDLFYYINLVKAINIYPCGRRLIFEGKTFLYGLSLFFLKLIFVIIKDTDPYTFCFFLPDMDPVSYTHLRAHE